MHGDRPWLSADGVALSFFLFAGAICLAPLLKLVASPSTILIHVIAGIGGLGGGVLASHHNQARIREPLLGGAFVLVYLVGISPTASAWLLEHWAVVGVAVIGTVAGSWSARLITNRRGTRLGATVTGLTFFVGLGAVGIAWSLAVHDDHLDTDSVGGVVVSVAACSLAIALRYGRKAGVAVWTLLFLAALSGIGWLPGMLSPPAVIGSGIGLIGAGCHELVEARRQAKATLPEGRVVSE